MDRFLRVLDVLCVFVRVRVHGNGLNTELLASPQDADGDLAAIGNQNFIDHFA